MEALALRGGTSPVPADELRTRRKNRLVQFGDPLDTFNPDASGSVSTVDDGPTLGERARRKLTGRVSTVADADADQSQSQSQSQSQNKGALASAWSAVAGAADWTAGSTDETLARQTDAEQGGGVLDGLQSAPADLSGLDEYEKTKSYKRLRQEARTADNWREGFDVAVQAGTDFVLDNPKASVQEGLQAAMKAPTELATGEQVSDEELGESAQDVAAGFGSFWETTPLSNPVTDTGVQLAADPVTAFLEAGTGVDADTGTTEAEVTTMELVEVPATLAGGGFATDAAKSLAGAGDEGALFLSGLGTADEGGTVASRVLSRFGDESGAADEATQTTRFGDGTRFDEPTTLADETVTTADDTTTATTLADDTTAAADDATVFSRLTSGVDDFLGTTSGKVTAGATGVLGASVLADAAGLFSASGGSGGGSGDGSGNHPPTDGTTWGEPQPAGTTDGGCSLVKQRSTGGGDVRFATLTGDSAGNVYALDASGERHPVTKNTPMGDYPLHSTRSDAVAACAASTDDTGATDDPAATWGKLQQDGDLGNGWALSHQSQRNGDKTRWFVTRVTESGGVEALNASAQVESVKQSTPLDQVPHFDAEEAARSAYQEWADANADSDATSNGGGSSSAWTEWAKLRQVEGTNWYIFGRTHTEDSSRVQFVVTGKKDKETVVYLNKSGEIVTERVTFSAMKGVKTALKNYRQRKANGDVPADTRPSGVAPRSSAIPATGGTPASGSGVGRFVEAVGGPKVALGLLAVVALVAYRRSQNGGN